MDRLVERLLSLGKPSEPSRLPTDLSRFLAERLELWEARAKGQGTVLELRPVSSLSEPVLLGRDRVGQILDNLVGNALEALADRGGRITVEAARPRAGEIVIAVADTGPGVPSDAVDRIFEPFFTTRNGGTGLGRFLSAELARQLGGDLRYGDQPEGGARFEVRLPC
jgi:signal transduction histidine kinase